MAQTAATALPAVAGLPAKPGARVFWITGLSGSGKTTVARALTAALRARRDGVVFLDGDAVREVFDDTAAHDADSRRLIALRNARLCRLLSAQGLDVVCATISMFADCRAWARAHVPGYVEIYLQVPLAELRRRDPKGLYAAAARGEIANVVGLDLPAELPREADLAFDNFGSMRPDDVVASILHWLDSPGSEA